MTEEERRRKDLLRMRESKYDSLRAQFVVIQEDNLPWALKPLSMTQLKVLAYTHKRRDVRREAKKEIAERKRQLKRVRYQLRKR